MNLKDYLIFYITASFILGIFLEYIFKIEKSFLFFLFLISLFIMIFLYLKRERLPQILKLSTLIFLFSFLGAWHFQNYYNKKIPQKPELFYQRINQNFIVTDEPLKKEWKTKLILKFKNSDEKLITWVNNLPKYKYGDELKISGWILPIQNFDEKFDYKNYLKKDDIYYEIKQPKITFIKSHQGNWIKEKLFQFKKVIINQIKKLLPEPESSLLAGILIGAQEDIDKEQLENFRKTGIIHIVVLSGFNLSILAEFIIIILSIFGNRIATIFGTLSIILFAIMTGASATIIRASIMAILVIIAKNLGKKTESLKLLSFAALIMLIFNPMLLIFDPSFQLSFLATLGLILIAPEISNLINPKNKISQGITEVFSATIAAQIIVSPLILFMMGNISLIAPIVNLLVLFLVPFTMIYSAIIILISFINFNFAHFLSYLSYLILKYDLIIINYFANFKYAIIEIKNFNKIKLSISYLILFIFFYIYFWRKKQ